jgi:glycosyltransferase involved in cell wall biosynthesis
VTLPLSVFIITRNEEIRIARCLDALIAWAGEIVLVDSGSTDRTMEIARSYGIRAMDRPWTGYGQQKRFAEELCKHDWVLNVDADEVVTPECAAEIEALFKKGAPEPAAYRIHILNVYPGQTKPRWLANDYNVVRLYHRSVASYSDDPVYDRVIIRGAALRQLSSPIHHFTNISVTHAVEKALNFSKFRAETSGERSAPLLKLRLVFEFPMVFLKTYLGRRHFTGGWYGFYFSLCHAFMRTTRIALLLEEQERRPDHPPRLPAISNAPPPAAISPHPDRMIGLQRNRSPWALDGVAARSPSASNSSRKRDLWSSGAPFW